MNNSTTQALEAIEKALFSAGGLAFVGRESYDLALQGLMDARHILKQQLADETRSRTLPPCECQGIRHTCRRFDGALVTLRED